MRRLFPALLLLLALAGAQPAAPAAAQSGDAIFQAVNQFRVANGLPPFSYNSRLATAAQRQANYMAEFNVFTTHTGYGGSTPAQRAVAAGYGGRVTEIIVGGTAMDAAGGVRWWRNSSVHYAILVSSRYSEAGGAFATDGRYNYYVVVAGSPSERPSTRSAAVDSPPPLIITPITLAAPRPDGSIVHVVQEGQALWSLAAHYDVPLSQLLLFNGLADDAFVHPGDAITIRLADGAVPPPTPTPATSHIVRPGQSLWSIALLYDIRFSDLLWLNAIDEDAVLRPGESVRIRLAPGERPPPTPTPITHHTVQSGQTLWEVALTYDLTLDQLLAYNDLTADSLIQPGDALRIRPQPPPPPSAFPPTFTPAPRLTPERNAAPTLTPSTASVAAVAAVSAAVPPPESAPPPTAVAAPPPPLNSPSSPLNLFFIAIGAALLVSFLYLWQRP